MNETITERFQTLMLRFHRLGGELPPLERLDITPAQVVYLDFLNKNPDCRLSDLAEALQYKPASVSAMVSSLEEKGLVSKTQGLDDGRSLSLSLTAKGGQAVKEIEDYRQRRVESILDKLKESEKDTLLKLLEKALL